MTRTARCPCGRCSITVKDNPFLNGVCHCNDCKRRTGSAFAWNAYFANDQILATTGDRTEYTPEAQPGRVRRRCSHCGATLWWTSPGIPGTGVAAGAFIDPPLPEPNSTYQHADHLPWVTVPTDWTRVS